MPRGFTWELPSGDKVTLVPFDELPLDAFWRIKDQHLDDMSSTLELLEVGCSADDLMLVKKNPLKALDGLLEMWSAADEVSLPES